MHQPSQYEKMAYSETFNTDIKFKDVKTADFSTMTFSQIQYIPVYFLLTSNCIQTSTPTYQTIDRIHTVKVITHTKLIENLRRLKYC